jgi:hypothetical protein
VNKHFPNEVAFLVGPSAAVRLLNTAPHRPSRAVLSAHAIAANPFMSGATINKLVQKAAADVSATAATRRPGPSLDEPAVTAAGLEGGAAPTTALENEVAAAFALKRETTATAVAAGLAASKREPVDTPADLEIASMMTKPADPHFETKCQIGLASCRKWIALEEGRARLFRRIPYKADHRLAPAFVVSRVPRAGMRDAQNRLGARFGT